MKGKNSRAALCKCGNLCSSPSVLQLFAWPRGMNQASVYPFAANPILAGPRCIAPMDRHDLKYVQSTFVMLLGRRHLLPTLKLVLPWLKDSSYQIVTLDTAAAACSPLQGALTTDALAQHNKAHPIGKSSSYGMVDVMARAASSGSLTRGLSGPGSATSSTEKSPASPQVGQSSSGTASCSIDLADRQMQGCN